jgi:hypothetical protein
MKKSTLLLMLFAFPAQAYTPDDPDMPFPTEYGATLPAGVPKPGSTSGTLKAGAIVCNTSDSLKVADSGRAITKAQMESLGCVVTGAKFHAQCLHCNLDRNYAFIAVTLPKSIEKIWARKEDFGP